VWGEAPSVTKQKQIVNYQYHQVIGAGTGGEKIFFNHKQCQKTEFPGSKLYALFWTISKGANITTQTKKIMSKQRAARREPPQKSSSSSGTSATSVNNNQHTHHGGIDLHSTIQQFGYATGFDARQHVSDYFRRQHLQTADRYLQELHQRQSHTGVALKRYAFRHYKQFIETSKEIGAMENEMLKLSHLLSEQKQSIAALQQVSLATTQEFHHDEESGARNGNGNGNGNGSGSSSGSSSGASSSLLLDPFAPPAPGATNMTETGLPGGGSGSRSDGTAGDVYLLQVAAVVDMMDELRNCLSMGKHLQAVDKSVELTSTLQLLKQLHRQLHRSEAEELLQQSLEQRTAGIVSQLVDALIVESRTSSSFASGGGDATSNYERQQTVKSLVRLGHSDKALELFLIRQSTVLKHAVRHIRFQGDIVIYVAELSRVVFHHIGATVQTYRQLFQSESQTGMMSTVIVWMTQEVQAFSALFQQQVFQADDSFGKVSKCLRCAFAACRSLEDRGIALTFILARMLTPALLAVVQRNYAEVQQAVQEQLRDDPWQVTEVWVLADDDSGGGGGGGEHHHDGRRSLKLSSSARFLYNAVRTLLHNITPLLDASVFPSATDLYGPVVLGMVRLLEKYLLAMARESQSRLQPDTDVQTLSIIANTHYLQDDLLPRVRREFQRVFQRASPELDAFSAKLQRLHRALSDSFAQKRVAIWLQQILPWQSLLATKYGRLPNGGDDDDEPDIRASDYSPTATGAMRQLVVYLGRLRQHVDLCLHSDAHIDVVSNAVEEVARALLDDSYWVASSANFLASAAASGGGGDHILITESGCNQLILDVRLLTAAASPSYITPRAAKLLKQVEKRAISNFFAQPASHDLDLSMVLMPKSWFEAAVANAVTVIGSIATYKDSATAGQRLAASSSATAAASPRPRFGEEIVADLDDGADE
jgi:hypothetical protein